VVHVYQVRVGLSWMDPIVLFLREVRVGPSWMDPIVLFLREDILLEDKSEAEKI